MTSRIRSVEQELAGARIWARDASDSLDRAEAQAARAEAQVRELREDLGLCREAADLLIELADDLKRFYESDKGWPSHIEAAGRLAADLRTRVLEARGLGP